MNYTSTRDNSVKVTAAYAIATGISPDGGLYVPESIPEFTYDELLATAKADYRERAVRVLEKYLTPENIENAPIDELFEIIKDKSHNKLTMKKAFSIREAAADTFGIKIAQDAFSFQLKQLIDRMNFLDKQIEALDCQILEYYEKFDCYLHTIPGIGMIAAAAILAEIGDINRFKSSSALVAFAGIDPTVRQSGEFSSTHNHMSKRGSPYLRHAIFLAATTCSFHNSPLNAYYKKKRDQGKHHLTATGAVARKLTTVIYAVLRDSKPYEPKTIKYLDIIKFGSFKNNKDYNYDPVLLSFIRLTIP